MIEQIRETKMKKAILLILSALLFVLTFTICWFRDVWFDSFFSLIFEIVIMVLLIGSIAALLVLSIIRIAKRKEFINFASIAILTTIVICVLFFPFREARTKLDLKIHYDDRMAVVEMIRNGELLPEDDLGNIVLPDEYRRLSGSGEVFQYQNDEEGQVICFWVCRGLSVSGATELVYSSKGWELIGTNFPYAVTIERLSEKWYYVVTE